MAEFLIQGETLKAIGEAIRGKTGGSDPIKPKDMASQINAIESGGGGTEEIEQIIDQSGVLDSTDGTVMDKVEQLIDYANFKNIIQESLNLNGVNGNMGYISVFRNTGIKDVSMFDFSKISWMSNAFRNTQIEELEIDITNTIYIDEMCSECKNLKRVVLKNMGSAVKSVRNAFLNNSLLESVGTLNFEGTTNTGNVFEGCNSLRDVSVVPETIKVSITFPSAVLSVESIQSIIDGLADLTGATAQTLTLNATVKAKLTEEQLATITSKNWNLA